MKVLDPSPSWSKTAEMLVSLGLKHSKRGLFAQPPVKLISKRPQLPRIGADSPWIYTF